MKPLRSLAAVVIVTVVVLALVAAAPAQQSAQRWEYINLIWLDEAQRGGQTHPPAYLVYRTATEFEAVELPVGSAPNVTGVLNQLGAEGWELVTVQPITPPQSIDIAESYLLKRGL